MDITNIVVLSINLHTNTIASTNKSPALFYFDGTNVIRSIDGSFKYENQELLVPSKSKLVSIYRVVNFSGISDGIPFTNSIQGVISYHAEGNPAGLADEIWNSR